MIKKESKMQGVIPPEPRPRIDYNANLMDHFDAFAYVVICPLGILTALGLFLGHIFSKELRKSPGDLVMMISFAELLLSLHWFTSALRTQFFTSDDQLESQFCTIEAYLAVIGGVLETSYNFLFLLYILFQVRNINAKKLSTVYLHVAACGFTIVSVSYQVLKGNLGRNGYGSCSVSTVSNSSLIFGGSLMLIIFSLAIYVVSYTRKVLPQHTKELANLKRNFVNFYRTYMYMIIYLWGLIFLNFVFQNLGENENDYTPKDKHISYSSKGYIFNLGKLGNLSKALTPVLLFYIRLRDPLIKQNIWYPFKKTFKKLKGEMDQENYQDLKSELASNTNDLMWINMLSSTIKESLHRTLLACIGTYYPELIGARLSFNSVTLTNKDVEDICIYNINAKELMKEHGLKENYPLLNCTFTVYAPRMFSRIISTYFRRVDFAESLNIIKNGDKIKKISESTDGQGGKSGEFFFLTHDRRLILKTTNDTEAAVFLKILKSYTKHFQEFPTSQIGRIFGLFDVNFEDAGRSVKLFVMEALDPVIKDGSLRKYDLKGSTINRKELETYNGLDLSSKIPEVMKDTDFENIEECIKLVPIARENLLASLKADVSFFQMHKIIDYSLIISVIDMDKLPLNFIKEELESRNHRIFKCAETPNLCYFLGIIDYFQLYDFNKRLERFFKSTIKCNCNLDTSAQPPRKYSQRFQFKMEEYFLSYQPGF